MIFGQILKIQMASIFGNMNGISMELVINSVIKTKTQGCQKSKFLKHTLIKLLTNLTIYL